MMEKIKEFIEENHFLNKQIYSKLCLYNTLNKDVYIYITGVQGHQGKSKLKQLLLDEGFTHVYQRNDMYDSNVYNIIYGDDDKIIDEYAKKLFGLIGYVIDFGSFYIPKFPEL